MLVTHDQDEALSLADRVAVIRDGRIGQCDTPQELYAHPATPELAIGLGETNLLAGRARGLRVETELGLLGFETREGPDELADGTDMVVLVRAEQIVLSAEPSGSHPGASVTGAEYYGHDAVVKLRPDWDELTTLVVRISEVTLPKEGTRVTLSVRGNVVAWPVAAAPDARGR